MITIKTVSGFDFIIRSAVSSDCADIAKIEKMLFGNNAWSLDNLHKELTLHFSKFIVAERDFHVIGYAIAWYITDEIQLLRIGIDPLYQRKKVGTSLLEHLINQSHNQNRITLEVANSNHSAIQFYKSLGFKECGIRKNYYQNDNAILMEKPLK